MAKMIPDIPTAKGAIGEHRLYAYLKAGLPDNFNVFHSLDLTTIDEGKGVFENEIDFLVVHRELGMLALEVKGGVGIKYYPKQRRWVSVSQSGVEYEIKDPFRQASTAVHRLVKEIKKRGIFQDQEGTTEAVPISHGYAVSFPDTEVGKGPYPASFKRELLIDRSDLGDIGERIPDIMHLWQREGFNRPMTTDEYSELYNRFLLPEFNCTLSISSRLEDEEAVIHRLTVEQCEHLRFLKSYKRALIQGYAGTGKTQMAMEKARRLAADGKDVLFLCFNSPLARYLEGLNQEWRDRITVDNYHNFAKRLIEKAGLPFVVPPREEKQAANVFWNKEVPGFLELALEKLQVRFDAVIIDEGQDFHRDWFPGILKLLKDPRASYLYIFYDERQNIFQGEMRFPVVAEPLVLYENCRNTRNISEVAARIGDVDEEYYHAEKNPVGEKVHFKAYRNSDNQPEMIERIVESLLKKGIFPGQMVILSPHTRERSCLAGIDEVAGCSLRPYDPEVVPDSISFSTVKSFKGLEADVIIFCDMDGKFPIHHAEDQYVAVSRAKHVLYVLHQKDWKPPKG